ncbi:MAG TPA: DUF4337 family protein [Nitrospirota bacterium]|nr:DUF4337 family protein [Nitrospirota bacterium]
MKVQIPNELKSDVPQTTFGKILAATPVVMAVVATMLAGLASSEMTRAQYDRSLGAQQQSKAGDQWSFFQAKRMRGAFQRNTAELLQAVSEVHPLNPSTLKKWAEKAQPKLVALLVSRPGKEAIDFLQRGEVPPTGAATVPDQKLKAALDGLENLKVDSEMAGLLAPIDNTALEAAVRAARDQSQAFDEATKPINQTIDQMDALVTSAAAIPVGAGAATGPSPRRDFTIARLRYTAARYEVEARLNQAIANLYELQVRKSNFSAERHHARSQKFFFGMLGAQFGVIISTFAMAARNRNLLWSLAAAAGVLATAFAIYVYLYV